MPLTAGEMIDAVKEAKGFASKAADLLDVYRATFYTYLNKYPTVQDALKDVREARHDHVENKLLDAVDSGNITAIIFYLKTQCPERGYVERSAHDVKLSGEVVIKWPEEQ